MDAPYKRGGESSLVTWFPTSSLLLRIMLSTDYYKIQDGP